MRYRFLYDGYRSSAYFWEIVTMCRKVLLVFLLVFLRYYPIPQVCLALLLFNCALLAQKYYAPHRYIIHKRLEFSALTTIYVLLTIGLLFVGNDIGGANLTPATVNFLTFLSFLINLIMLMICVLFIFDGLRVMAMKDDNIFGKIYKTVFGDINNIDKDDSGGTVRGSSRKVEMTFSNS